MNWRLGVSSALFSPDTIHDKLEECALAGFECVEIGIKKLDGKTCAYIEGIAKELECVDIDIWSIHLPFGDEYDISETDNRKRTAILEKLFELIDISSQLKPKVFVVHGSYEPIEDKHREARISACIESLKTLVEKCNEYGAKLALECLPRTCIGNCSDEILRIVKAVPGLYVCFDTNHLTVEQPVDFVHRVGEYIISTHVSDYDGIDERHWLPGRGSIDWYRLLGSLNEIGYTGPIIFEVVNRRTEERITPKTLIDNWHTLIGSCQDISLKSIAIGCDEAGFLLKEEIKKHLKHMGLQVEDYGIYDTNPSLYPDVAVRVAQAIASGKHERGVLVCGTGMGMAIAANKVPGIRAAVCHDSFSAERARKSNDAQIMALGARIIGSELAKNLLSIWLKSEFQGGSSTPKVDRICHYERQFMRQI